MMRIRTQSPVATKEFTPKNDSPAKILVEEPARWEVRPCGMLVQKRSEDEVGAKEPVSTIRLRVKHGSNYHEIYISSLVTFGELKKLLAERTGLHPQDQKILFKDKERDSSAYLDTSGVKDRSKLVVVEDSGAQAKRLLEMRRTAKMDKAAKSISQISQEVDKLAFQVSAMEAAFSEGEKFADGQVLKLIELLMNELIKLDGVVADGDAKLQRRVQVKRVQKYVETLDVLKLKSASAVATMPPPPHQQPQKKQPPPSPRPPSVIVTTKWETFDSLFSPKASTSTSTSTATTATSTAAPTPRFDWELF
ncbi:hypothetical protein HPP92_014620 [Vanilla planifolia]|uniref:BAG family molecular chaperone regulator 1 n=1 Tax=Vanilla planifolia TaxID=51239 RepID=A0A835QLS9_VANPL|nr:hypothetical protein HPP92_015044 [Vanilla planifolia]KAG0474934.1 hypothetical protein HPP92_014620 [Vanilla planifolia]